MGPVIIHDPDGSRGQLLAAAAAAQTALDGAVLVGGLAVVIRTQHGRATQDVDTAVASEEPVAKLVVLVGEQAVGHSSRCTVACAAGRRRPYRTWSICSR